MPSKIIDIPLSGGLRQKVDERWIDPASLVGVSNGIWIDANSIEKRPGYTSSDTGRTICYPSQVAGFGGAHIQRGAGLLAAQGKVAISDGFYIYAPNDQNLTLQWVDMAPPCVAKRRPVGNSSHGAYNATVGNYNGQDLYVWEDAAALSGYANILHFALVDEVTGKLISSGPIAGSSIAARAPRIVISTHYAIVFFETAANAIGYAVLDFTDSTLTWTLHLGAFTAGGFAYSGKGIDVSPSGFSSAGINYFTIAYTTGTGIVVAQCGHATGSTAITVNTTSLVTVPTTNPTACAVRWDQPNGRCWVVEGYLDAGSNNIIAGTLLTVVWNGTTFTVAQAFALTTIASYAPTSNLSHITQLGVEDSSGTLITQCCAIWECNNGSTNFNSHVGWGRLTAAGAAQAFGPAWQVQLVSKPFGVSTPDLNQVRVYAMCATSQAQQSHVLCEFDISGFGVVSVPYEVMPHPCAVLAPRLTVSYSPDMRGVNTLSDVTNYANKTAGQYISAGVLSETSNKPSSNALFSAMVDFGSIARSQSAQVANLDYLTGTAVFDGNNAVECSTVQQIDWSGGGLGLLSGNAAGGNLTNGQTYVYVVVPEWRDALGNVHQGQPSAPVSIAVPAGAGTAGSVTGKIPCLSLTCKGLPNRVANSANATLYLVPYRTIFIGGAMSTSLYRLVGDNPGAAYANAPTAGQFLTFSDTASDASLQTNALLPTTGGVLEADCPSAFQAITSHGPRVYGLGDDARTVWISTAQQDGLPCYFNDGVQSECVEIGELNAIWSQDDKLLVGNATGIAYAVGYGPNITGAQSDLSPWVKIPTDVGPVDARTICVTPIGTVFRTIYGLALLDRSLSVHSDFGDPITNLLGAGFTAQSIVLHPTRPEIHVYISFSLLGTPVTAVAIYNYRFSAWSTALISDPDSTYANIVSAMPAAGNLYCLTSFGRLYREKMAADAQQFYDTYNSNVNVWVPLKVQWGWVKLGGTMRGLGFARKIQATWMPQDWSDVTVSIAADYNDGAIVNSWAWPASLVSTFANIAIPTVVEMRPPTARGTALQVTIQDAAPANASAITGQGPRIIALSYEIESFENLVRLPGAQRG